MSDELPVVMGWDQYQALTADRERARAIAVALEQENAELRERLEFATWGMA